MKHSVLAAILLFAHRCGCDEDVPAEVWDGLGGSWAGQHAKKKGYGRILSAEEGEEGVQAPGDSTQATGLFSTAIGQGTLAYPKRRSRRS